MSEALLAEAMEIRRSARRLLGAAEVQAVYDRMANAIAEKVAGTNPVIVAVMHGGVFTAVELCRRFEFPYEFAYVHPTRYGGGLSGGDLEWAVEPKPALEGRTVVIVDDVLDIGITLAELKRSMSGVGIGELYTAVLVGKQLRQRIERPSVDFVGVWIEDAYVFGCGMDYKGYWRGLPELLAAGAEEAQR